METQCETFVSPSRTDIWRKCSNMKYFWNIYSYRKHHKNKTSCCTFQSSLWFTFLTDSIQTLVKDHSSISMYFSPHTHTLDITDSSDHILYTLNVFSLPGSQWLRFHKKRSAWSDLKLNSSQNFVIHLSQSCYCYRITPDVQRNYSVTENFINNVYSDGFSVLNKWTPMAVGRKKIYTSVEKMVGGNVKST